MSDNNSKKRESTSSNIRYRNTESKLVKGGGEQPKGLNWFGVFVLVGVFAIIWAVSTPQYRRYQAHGTSIRFNQFLGAIEEKSDSKLSTAKFDYLEGSNHLLVKNAPLSTFSIDVDTASYGLMEYSLSNYRGIENNLRSALRVEEMINYFPYNYTFPEESKNQAVNVRVDQASSPWNKNRKLVRVAIQGGELSSEKIERNKNIVFLIDTSGSMSPEHKLPLVKKSIKKAYSNLSEDDRISLVTYAGSSNTILDGADGNDFLQLKFALYRLSAGGGTNGAGGLKAAYDVAKDNYIEGGINRIILCTDGDFNIGLTSNGGLVESVKSMAKEHDIGLSILGYGMYNINDSLLETLTNKGNGNYAFINDEKSADKYFNKDFYKNVATIAHDVKVQVEFNPAEVVAYRLIGYENREMKDQEFNDDKKDASDLGSGQSVTALYELVLKNEKIDIPAIDESRYSVVNASKHSRKGELLQVKVRFKEEKGAKTKRIVKVLKNKNIEFNDADKDLRFATAVASFGLKLRHDKLLEKLSYQEIRRMAYLSSNDDDFRRSFIDLVYIAEQAI